MFTLLGRFTPLGFTFAFSSFRSLVLRASQSLCSFRLRASRSHLVCLAKARFVLHAHGNLKKKKIFQSNQNTLKRIEMQKSLYPFDPLQALPAHSAKSERRSATLPTPCHSQGPKECPCQVSCRLDQNCGR